MHTRIRSKFTLLIPAICLLLLSSPGCGVESTELNGGESSLPLEGEWLLTWYNEAPYFTEWKMTFIRPDQVSFSGGGKGTYQVVAGTLPTEVLLALNGPKLRSIITCPTHDSLMLVTPTDQNPLTPPAPNFEFNQGYTRWRFRRVN